MKATNIYKGMIKSEDSKFPEPNTTEREVAIFRILAASDDPLSISEIRNAVLDLYEDKVSIQAYHKTINRLEAVGQLECIEEDNARGKLYSIAPYLHSANPITLDDLYELTSAVSPSDQIALVTEAQEYLEDKKDTILKTAANLLSNEDPRELFYEMILYHYNLLHSDIEMFKERDLRSDKKIKIRIENQYRELKKILYRYLSLPISIVNLIDIPEILKGNFTDENGLELGIQIDHDGLKEVLKHRIFGPNFLYSVNFSQEKETLKNITVAGSDGSTHVSSLHLRTAQQFLDDPNLFIKFNNSMAYVHMPESFRSRIPFPYHSIPITRSAMDDPTNKGMVVARPMFPEIEDDSIYEHMSRCATDVVQWRVDRMVFSGTARAISPSKIYQTGTGSILPPPQVYLRDGTVSLQEREFSHYSRDDEYGEFVREGQSLAQEILRRLTSEDNSQVFGGTVKSTQLKVFSKIISWYISHGSKNRNGGKPIDPDWDKRYSSAISDNQLMTNLLSTLVKPENVAKGEYWISCCVVRRFHSTTEYFTANASTKKEWDEFFEAKKRNDRATSEKLNQPSFWDMGHGDDDAFIYLCKNADYGLFYIGHTYGNPLPSIPRYEFFDSIRRFENSDDAAQRVARNIEKIVRALDLTKFHLDNDHNFLTGKKITKIIPYVVHQAHETGKVLGRYLESELRSAVISSLARFRKMRGIRPNDVDLIPVSIKNFISKVKDSLKNEEGDESEGLR